MSEEERRRSFAGKICSVFCHDKTVDFTICGKSEKNIYRDLDISEPERGSGGGEEENRRRNEEAIRLDVEGERCVEQNETALRFRNRMNTGICSGFEMGQTGFV
ncbi:hypothetical protein F2Q69_00010540 [Brassica cretica]|uniref:Uncharacterized protein n=1 Tax=Brassica cretica TaxID=69181 RepID=A0A8S9R025_BRACR|nr:hypothetical protein F2Q69_00010540 [Brassica cretica]